MKRAHGERVHVWRADRRSSAVSPLLHHRHNEPGDRRRHAPSTLLPPASARIKKAALFPEHTRARGAAVPADISPSALSAKRGGRIGPAFRFPPSRQAGSSSFLRSDSRVRRSRNSTARPVSGALSQRAGSLFIVRQAWGALIHHL